MKSVRDQKGLSASSSSTSAWIFLFTASVLSWPSRMSWMRCSGPSCKSKASPKSFAFEVEVPFRDQYRDGWTVSLSWPSRPVTDVQVLPKTVAWERPLRSHRGISRGPPGLWEVWYSSWASVSPFGSSLFTHPFPPGCLLYHEQEERHFFLNLLLNLHAKSIWQEVL